ncbi:uncharacterized protein TRUGW13939_01335 [Talaromyces rugulosus]|uniref:xyloglucan-specific endo-beta-1,4-glucanase n=1 Tax=Talaromyces rugulosus TaxID=121627 RepID=A0A7H8QJZ4_TALRU|nr:uncharacterized protein TRUGW13939_01335 [Talaromyces rugulosus]QKX54250.1 hypothetical protein TRUGW13939_01335 [Talaromyces rugulosus]
MAFRWIVNAGLLAIPIGTTIGVLVGIDAQRQASGQQPLFSGGDNGSSTGGNGGLGGGGSTGGDGGNGGGSSDDNGISWIENCNLTYGIEPPTKGQEYILNPNQWGVLDGTSGMCMNVTAFNNGSYATNSTGPEFAVTWSYKPGSSDQPVHAFPNIMIEGDTLPVALSDLKTIHMDVEWTYGLGNDPSATTDDATLKAEDLNANVAIDMFLDSDKTVASNSSQAKYEIMIWFAQYGPSTDPIGYDGTLDDKGIITNRTVNGTLFHLYSGKNGQGQNVLTYITDTTTESFSGNLQELLTLPESGITASNFPADTDYLGHFSFGSEAFYSLKNVTFHVPTFAIDIRT